MPQDIAVDVRKDGSEVRVIAGTPDSGISGPVKRDDIKPIYMDVTLPPNGEFKQHIKVGDNAFIYVIEGHFLIGEKFSSLPAKQLGGIEWW